MQPETHTTRQKTRISRHRFQAGPTGPAHAPLEKMESMEISEVAAWSLSLHTTQSTPGDIRLLDNEAQPFIFDLPRISPNDLNSRIQIQRNVVSAIVRRAYFLLKESAMNEDRETPLYLHGPRGIGKSYLLYMFAADLAVGQRSRHPNIRVTYISDCGTWILGNYNYFLTELIVTFSSEDSSLNVCSKAEAIQRTFDEQSRQNQLLELLRDLRKYVTKNKLRWFIIFDQLNAFHADKIKTSAPAEFALRIVNLLAKSQSRSMTVLGSASANNERFPVEFGDWEAHSVDVVPNCYEESEFGLWCTRMGLLQTADSTKEILYYTGGVPLELDYFMKTKAGSISEKLEKYRSTRLEALIGSHRKFCKSLTTENDQSNLQECIGRMALHLNPPAYLTSMDRQLLVVVEDTEAQGRRIVALFPLARLAVMTFHSNIIQDSLKMVAEIVFRDQCNYTNDVKGRVVERYIITSLEEKRVFSFRCPKLGRKAAASFKGEIQDVIYFNGTLLPIRSTVSASLCTLIVPTSSKYPGVDFFIWNPADSKKILLAVQVTAQESLKAHMKKRSFLCTEWCRFLGIPETSVRTLWLAPKECIDVDNLRDIDNGLDNYILAFEELVDLCPIIQTFKRGQQELTHSRPGPALDHDQVVSEEDIAAASAATASAAAAGGGRRREHEKEAKRPVSEEDMVAVAVKKMKKDKPPK